jgi:glycosyltransferase involved in cell wall biosynthesis
VSQTKVTAPFSADRVPLVSVVVPSYNHSIYIEKAIISILSQDFEDFELLISDDASSDGSWEIIRRFKDRRIRIFKQQENLGPVGNLVFLIKQACCKYVALLNSDDYWRPGKLGKQFAIMEENPRLGACFTWADLVDENDRVITGAEAIWNDVFRQPNRSQGQWLRHFFSEGNCICHPSMLIRRDVYNQLGFYNPGLKQLPDFEMWIRLVKRYPIHIVEESLVSHLRTGLNTSALNTETSERNLNELLEIFHEFLYDISDEMFIEGFGEYFRLKGVTMTPERIHCEKLFLLLDRAFEQTLGRAAALRGFYQAFREPDLEQILLNEYHFSVFDYYKLTGSIGFGHYRMLAVDGGIQPLPDVVKSAMLHWCKSLPDNLFKKIWRLWERSSRP